MQSITGGAPKELLPLGRQTVLARVVAEARQAGADDIVIVNSPQKGEIDIAAAEMGCRVVYQPAMRGLGHAIAMVEAESDALVLLGDCVFAGGSPLGRMSNLISMGIDGVIAVETVQDDEVSRYGILEIDGMGTVERILEKPKASETSSRYAVAARYAFSGRFLAYLNAYVSENGERNDEINLTEAIVGAIERGFEFKAVALQPGQQRVDCGTPEEYAEARRLSWD
jgi:UTP-glucose-1-phosphate uridylyltransferase